MCSKKGTSQPCCLPVPSTQAEGRHDLCSSKPCQWLRGEEEELTAAMSEQKGLCSQLGGEKQKQRQKKPGTMGLGSI